MKAQRLWSKQSEVRLYPHHCLLLAIIEQAHRDARGVGWVTRREQEEAQEWLRWAQEEARAVLNG